MRRICFVLPSICDQIIGGYKVVYTYANMFAADGWRVTVVYLSCPFGSRHPRLLVSLKYSLRRLLGLDLSHVPWMKLHENVRERHLVGGRGFSAVKADAYVATAVDTAYALAAIGRCAGKMFYLVQGFEAWNGRSDEYVFDSYRFPMRKIVISDFLLEKVRAAGETAALVPNGIDFDTFSMYIPPEEREPDTVSLLYHADALKGVANSLSALELVRRKYPALKVTMFGSPDEPAGLPGYVSYYKRPGKELHNAIYNKSAIFISSSESEGFGLTVAEAMACGAAVCCTDIGGFRMFARHEDTALLSPMGDVSQLAENILRLIEDPALRVQLSRNGNRFVQRFTWESAYREFLAVIRGGVQSCRLRNRAAPWRIRARRELLCA